MNFLCWVLFILLEFVEHLFEVHQDSLLHKHIDLIDYVIMLNDQQYHLYQESNDFHHSKRNYNSKFFVF